MWFSVEVCSVKVQSPILDRVNPSNSVNTLLSSQPCKHTNTPRLLASPVKTATLLQHTVEVIDQRTSLANLKCAKGCFPQMYYSFFQTVKEICPALLRPTGLPSGFNSVCHIQRNAYAAISGSTITAGPLCLFVRISSASFFNSTPHVK